MTFPQEKVSVLFPGHLLDVCRGGHWQMRGKQNILFPVGQSLSVVLSLAEGRGRLSGARNAHWKI